MMWLILICVIAIFAIAALLFSFLGLRALKKGVAYHDEIFRAMYRSLAETGKDRAFVKVLKKNGEVLVTITKRGGLVYLAKEGEIGSLGSRAESSIKTENSAEKSNDFLCNQELFEGAILELSKFDSRDLRLLVPPA